MKVDNSFGAGFLQYEVQFGQPEKNLAIIRALVSRMSPAEGTLLVLPELWASGFAYDQADKLADETPALLESLTDLARQYSMYLAGSLLERGSRLNGDKPVLFNTLFVSGPDGVVGKYQKRHLFSLWDEDEYFSPGEISPPIQTPWYSIGGIVCYDLRFPEIARQHVFQGVSVLVVSAQWPAVRLDHWRILLQARAVENQVFVIACNGCGRTGENELGGTSMVIGPDGTILAEAGQQEMGSAVQLEPGTLAGLRERFCPAGERPRRLMDSGKCVGNAQLMEHLAAIRKQGSRVAFTNGCFDILHSGHVSYLERARETADCLVVGLNSDSSVRRLKGDGRPVNSESERARVLAALGCVDFVVLFSADTPLGLINEIKPDVLVKGADWQEENIVGAKEVRDNGGQVVRVMFEHDLSTTELISRIRE